jgi:hypothetical protein
MAAAHEDWSEWEVTVGDGLDEEDAGGFSGVDGAMPQT